MRAKFRALLSRRSVGRLDAELRAIAADSIAPVVGAGACDVVNLAELYVAAALLAWCGWNPDDRRRLKRLNDNFSPFARRREGGTVPPLDADGRAAATALRDYVIGKVCTEGCSPELLSGDDALQWPEVVAFLAGGALAGIDAITAALGFAMLELADRPELRDLLRRDPTQVRVLIHGVLRIAPPGPFITRWAAEEMCVAGRRLVPGDRVDFHLGAAGTERGDTIQIEDGRIVRHAHLAFGTGPRACPARHLVELALAMFVEEWLARVPDFQTARGFEARIRQRHGGAHELVELPLRWSAAAATGRQGQRRRN